ncbi:MAG: CHASE domain-containing protein [Hyphomicrobium sp.]
MNTRFKSVLPALVVLLLAMAAASLTALLVKRDVGIVEKSQFESEAGEVRDAVADAMNAYGMVLRAGVGMFKAQGQLTAAQWKTFVETLDVGAAYPGFQGLGYSAVVHKNQIEALENEQHRLGNTTFKVHPLGGRTYYTAIMFLEPDDWRNRRALGFDMFSEPVRREAMERARDSGRPALSGKVTLLQETKDDVQAGTLLYLPIYKGDQEPNDIQGRRAGLTGFMYAAFRMKDLLRSVLKGQTPAQLSAFDIAVYDGSVADPEAVLFSSTSKDQARSHAFKLRYPLEVAGEAWTMDVSADRPMSPSIDRSKPWLVLVAGSIIAVLVAGITGSLALSREKMQATQEALAKEVTERKRAQEAAEMANNELIHRVKNTLAVVSAIASQTVRYSSSLKDFSNAFRERLASLARVQDLLRPNSNVEPDLGVLVREVLQPYASAGSHELIVEGSRAPIARNDIVLFSLALNELATNAMKYGAWSVPDGKVRVTWQLEHSSENDDDEGISHQAEMIVLRWVEEGGPPIVGAAKKGFGSAVMQFAIERGLRGHIDVDFAREGIRYTIQIPLKPAQIVSENEKTNLEMAS